MLVAKLPGSTYATAAMNAGPRNGSTARTPRRSPVSARSAASMTRASPGRASSPSVTWRSSGIVPVTGSANSDRPASADRGTKAERLRGAGVGGRLVQALVQRPVLGHQRRAAAPRRLLLGDQGVGGEQQACH